MGFHLTLATRPGGGSPGAPRATALRLVQSLAIMLTALALVAEKVGDSSLEGGGFHPSIALSAAWVTRWYVRLQPALLFQCADEQLALATEHYRMAALIRRGWCLTALGRADEGIPLLTAGLAGYLPRRAALAEPHRRIWPPCAAFHSGEGVGLAQSVLLYSAFRTVGALR